MERVRTALVNGVEEAGSLMRRVSGNRNGQLAEHARRWKEVAVRGVREIEPQVSVWGEENLTQKMLVICTLDAATNYSRHLDEYSVMAAYCIDGRPAIGVVHLPESRETYVAEARKGTRIEGRRLSVGSQDSIAGALIACGCDDLFDDHARKGMITQEVLTRGRASLRNFGSIGRHSTLLAWGRVDAVVAPFAEPWNMAAYLLMMEAGATVTDWRGSPIALDSESMVASAPGMHGGLIELLGGVPKGNGRQR